MKKFLAILTIVAMLSSMVVIGASADTSTYAFEEDFEAYTRFDVPKDGRPKNNATKADFVALKSDDDGDGVYKVGYGTLADASKLKDADGTDGSKAIKGDNFWIKVGGFFTGKRAGTYTLSFDYKKGDNTSSVSVRRLDVGKAVNNTSTNSWDWVLNNEEGFDSENNGKKIINVDASNDGWQTVTETFYWSPENNTPIASDADKETFDADALCLKLQCGDENNQEFIIDNIKISTLPIDATYALESRTVLGVTLEDTVYETGFEDYDFNNQVTRDDRANNSATNFGGLKNAQGIVENGVFPPHGATLTETTDKQQGAAASYTKMWIVVGGFFAGRTEGTYKVEFDYKKDASIRNLNGKRVDIAGTVNLNSSQNRKPVNTGTEGFHSTTFYKSFTNDTTSGDWVHASATFHWTGHQTPEFTDPSNESKFDKDAFFMSIEGVGTDWGTGKVTFEIDNVKVSWVDTKETVTDYSGKNMTVTNRLYNVDKKAAMSGVVINAAYDQNGNLMAVNTADISVEQTEDYAETIVTLPIPAGVTKNWQFKGFVWSDLDNEIEPITDESDILGGEIFNGGFEIMTKTSAATTAARDNVSRYWESDGNTTDTVTAITTDKVSGNYAVQILNADGSNGGGTLYSNKSETNNVVYDLFSKYGPGKYTFEICVKFGNGGTLTPMMYIYDGTNKIGCRPRNTSGTNVGLTPEASNIWRVETLDNAWVRYVYTIDTTLFDVTQCVPSEQNHFGFTTWAGTTYTVDNFSFVGFEAAE